MFPDEEYPGTTNGPQLVAAARSVTEGQPVKAETPSGVPQPVGPSYPDWAVQR